MKLLRWIRGQLVQDDPNLQGDYAHINRHRHLLAPVRAWAEPMGRRDKGNLAQ